MLVYESMSNENLWDQLSMCQHITIMNWGVRYKTALGAAGDWSSCWVPASWWYMPDVHDIFAQVSYDDSGFVLKLTPT